MPSAVFGAFVGIAAIFGLTALAVYPLIRRSYLLWVCVRAAFFTIMVFAIFPLDMAGSIPVESPRLAWAEAALAVGTGATGPFLATYLEPRVKIGRMRTVLFAMLPLGLLAALCSLGGAHWPFLDLVHDVILLGCVVILILGLRAAIKANSRTARVQILGWGPLLLIGLVAFTYEIVMRSDLPFWPYLLLGGLIIDFMVTAIGIVDGFIVVQKERDTALQDIQAAQRMILIDPLTNIANRRGLEKHFANASTRRPTGIALIDCDHFKRINDQFGHDMGDRVLCAVAHALDGQSHFAARLGGEEFVVLLDGPSWQDAAEHARQSITDSVRAAVPELPYSVTASAGLAHFDEGDTLHSAMKRADQALYAAKEAGRDRSLSLTRFNPRPTGLTRGLARGAFS